MIQMAYKLPSPELLERARVIGLTLKEIEGAVERTANSMDKLPPYLAMRRAADSSCGLPAYKGYSHAADKVIAIRDEVNELKRELQAGLEQYSRAHIKVMDSPENQALTEVEGHAQRLIARWNRSFQ